MPLPYTSTGLPHRKLGTPPPKSPWHAQAFHTKHVKHHVAFRAPRVKHHKAFRYKKQHHKV